MTEQGGAQNTKTPTPPEHTKADLPQRITAASFVRAVGVLTDHLRGSLREDGRAKQLFDLLVKYLWKIASQEPTEDIALQFALALDELDDDLAKPPLDDASIQRMDALEQQCITMSAELADVRAALHALQENAKADLESYDACIATYERTIAEKDSAIATAETARDERAESALRALRSEEERATRAISELTALLTDVHTAHDAVTHAVRQSAPRVSTAGERTALEAHQRACGVWIDRAEEEIGESHDALQQLRAQLDAINAQLRINARDVKARAAHRSMDANCRSLEQHIVMVREERDHVRRRLEDIRARLHALDVLAKPAPDIGKLPDIPAVAMIAHEDIPVEPVAPETDAMDASLAPAINRLAAVLFDIVAQKHNYSVGRIARAAYACGILDRLKIEAHTFCMTIISQENGPVIGQFLDYGGAPPKSGPHAHTYRRTTTPVPSEWYGIITAEERARFPEAFEAAKTRKP